MNNHRLDRVKATRVVGVSLLVFLSGCATTPHVGYVSKSPKQASKNIFIQVINFEDSRPVPERGKLGSRYNQYGMNAGDVLEPASMVEGLQNAFITELQNAGYDIVTDGRDLVLQGSVLSVVCNQNNSSQAAAIKMRIVLLDKGQEVLNNVYQGNSKVRFTFDITCSDAFNDAIRNLVTSFAKDLDEYVKT